MYKLPFRKIAAVLLFILIAALSFIVFVQQEVNLNDRKSLFLFSGIILSALFLLILNLTKSVKYVKQIYNQEIRKEGADQKNEDKSNLKIEEETEHFIVGILKDLQLSNDLKSFSEKILKNFAVSFNIVQGIFYIKDKNTGTFKSSATYAFITDDRHLEFNEGEGLNGQIASDKDIKLLTDLAEGYLVALSGLGSCSLENLLLIPFVHNDETIALAEIAAFESFPNNLSGIYRGINQAVTNILTKFI